MHDRLHLHGSFNEVSRIFFSQKHHISAIYLQMTNGGSLVQWSHLHIDTDLDEGGKVTPVSLFYSSLTLSKPKINLECYFKESLQQGIFSPLSPIYVPQILHPAFSDCRWCSTHLKLRIVSHRTDGWSCFL